MRKEICIFCKRKYGVSIFHENTENGYECPKCESKRLIRNQLMQKGIIWSGCRENSV